MSAMSVVEPSLKVLILLGGEGWLSVSISIRRVLERETSGNMEASAHVVNICAADDSPTQTVTVPLSIRGVLADLRSR